MGNPILVATDGTTAALGAIRFAGALEELGGQSVQLLGVVEPVPVFDAGFMVAVPEMELYESRRDSLRDEIFGQVEAATGKGDQWPISVQAGVPAPRIVKHAEEIGAETIIMGLGRHGAMDRVFGTETSLQVLRLSHIPVLAVPETFHELPRSALMGVDFSLFSQKAAEVAIDLLQPPWEVHLVHVLSGMEFLPNLSEEWRGDYEGELSERLGSLAEGLAPPAGCSAHVHILEGEPSHELLAFAKGRSVDLLVAGSHGHSFVGRLLMGSVSTRLIRSAHLPVLVVPPVERSEELLAEEAAQARERSWVQELNEFTKVNVGRRTTLVVNDPQTSPRECGRGFPLRGVDYDPRRDCVDIMLGRSGTVEGHLTHSITAPREIRVTRRGDGKAEALEVDCRGGKVVLKIHLD